MGKYMIEDDLLLLCQMVVSTNEGTFLPGPMIRVILGSPHFGRTATYSTRHDICLLQGVLCRLLCY